jgi:hypothetical protein
MVRREMMRLEMGRVDTLATSRLHASVETASAYLHPSCGVEVGIQTLAPTEEDTQADAPVSFAGWC